MSSSVRLLSVCLSVCNVRALYSGEEYTELRKWTKKHFSGLRVIYFHGISGSPESKHLIWESMSLTWEVEDKDSDRVVSSTGWDQPPDHQSKQ